MRKMTRRVLGLILAMVMVISQFAGVGTTTVAAEETTEYTFTAETSATSVKVGDSITLSSKVLCGEEEVTDLKTSELYIWWSVNGDNWGNATFGYGENEDGRALEATATFSAAGTYYLVGKLQNASWTTLKEVYFTIEVAENTADGGNAEDNPEEVEKEYAFTAEASATSVKVGETITLSSDVLYGEDEITDLKASELYIWWSVNGDNWSNATFDYGENEDGRALEATATFSAAGTYYLVGKLQNASWTTLKEVYFTIEVAENSAEEDGGSETVTYDITVTPNATEVEQGETVTYTAVVTKNGETVTDLAAEGLKVWWWADKWEAGNEDGLTDAVLAGYDSTNGTSLSISAQLPSVGKYYMIAKLESSAGTKMSTATVTTTATEGGEVVADVYEVIVAPEMKTVKAGETVSLSATVTKNGTAITDLSAEGLSLWWWTDSWNDHIDGLSDAIYSNYDNNSGKSLVADVNVPSIGKYYIAAELQKADGTKITTAFSTITTTDPNAFTASDDNYTVVVTVDNLAPEAGDTVKMSAKVTAADGTEVADLATAGISLWWWTDVWMSGHENGLTDATYSNYDNNSGKSLTADVTLPSVGTYYIIGQLEYNGTKLPVVIPMTTTAVEVDTSITGEITVEKIANLPEDFIMGMDISSVISLFASGVTYKDFEGNTIDNITDFCKFLASNGITHIRVRVWNNPYDTNGNGYGGGNCDVATATKIAEGCRAAGLKMLIDFHCSDLWADPGKQQAPKAWAGYSVSEKATAVEEFIGSALKTIDPNCKTVDMVQVGNETTGGFVGVYDTEDMCTLFSAGAKAVHAYNEDVKVVIHVTNPEKGNVTKWASNLDTYKVDYDVLATSYYPYWHGTLANLQSELKTVKDTYGKDVMVAETSYAYTLEDSDGHSNTVRVGNNDSSENALQPFSVQGQATSIRDVMEVVNNAGGLGVFYWESAWITVGDIRGLSGSALDAQIAENKAIWEKYGSGWASSFAAEYDAKDAGQWYGGSAVDNEAMFYPDGTPTAALYVWNYVKTGAVSKYVTVEAIANPEAEIDANATVTLPETVTVTYNNGDVEESVVWNEKDVAKINTAVPGTYKVNGTVTFSKEINNGTYEGKTTAAVVYTLTVKQPNLITDTASAGFEKGTDYVIGGKGISPIPAKDDPYSGSGSMHWYYSTATTGTVTYNKVITLEAGTYAAEIKTQGYAGDKVTLQILSASDEVLFEGEATSLEGWAVWKTADIEFKLTKTTDVKLNIVVEMQDGGWGTADELYLYQVAKATSKPGYQPVVTPEEDTTSTEEPATTTKTETALEEETEETEKPEKKVKEEIVAIDGVNVRVLVSTEVEGVELSGEEKILPKGADFEIIPMDKDSKTHEKADAAVKEHATAAKAFVVYEMNLIDEDGTQIHELEDYISVTVPMPEDIVVGEGQQLVVYRLEEDGTMTKCETTVEDGKVIFATNHFSTYVFVVEDMNATSAAVSDTVGTTDQNVLENNAPEENTTEVNAGGSIPMGAVFAAVVVFIGFVGFYVFAKQRKMVK
ncbi:MAG: glycosyl hydrolase 53 family protein [Roseburia sp.]|nr:glycosyl hydrolase 53 family protein [Roseburia sp.]